MKLRGLIRSQSIVTLAAGMIFPYYLLFLKNLGNSFTKYGLAFAVFTISSALVSQWVGQKLDKHSSRIMLLSSLGMMAAMLAFPWVMSYGWVLVLQLLMGTRASVADGNLQRYAENEREGAAGRSDRAGCSRRHDQLLSFLDDDCFRLRRNYRRLCDRLAYDQRVILRKRAAVWSQRLGDASLGKKESIVDRDDGKQGCADDWRGVNMVVIMFSLLTCSLHPNAESSKLVGRKSNIVFVLSG